MSTPNPRPIVGSWTEEIYNNFLPIASRDEMNAWALLKYLDSIGFMTQEIVDLVRDGPQGQPGWSVIVDIDRAPDKGLPWLAQLAGVTLLVGMTPAQQRALINQMPGTRRGTRAAMVEAAKETLTGAKGVLITERYQGFAYRLLVLTKTAETPNAAATLTALLSQKPAGIVLTHTIATAQIYLTLRDGPPSARTYQQVKDQFATYQLARDFQP